MGSGIPSSHNRIPLPKVSLLIGRTGVERGVGN
jgi:hypothetical protein